MNLSKHFTLEELTASQEATRSGIRNTPNAAQIESLTSLCVNVLEPLRERVRRPVIVSSGFRSASINRRIGGSNRSQHCKGEAADISIPGMSVAEVLLLIRSMGLPFDQLIDEYGAWVHVSHAKKSQRHQVLLARRVSGKTEYRVV